MLMTPAQKPGLPLNKQIAYAIGQLGWSTLVNIIGLQLHYFYLPPENAGLPGLITGATFFVVLNAITLIAAFALLPELGQTASGD
jgi:GPH family glycoside/pentoside/hexuronide:cation symporter